MRVCVLTMIAFGIVVGAVSLNGGQATDEITEKPRRNDVPATPRTSNDVKQRLIEGSGHRATILVPHYNDQSRVEMIDAILDASGDVWVDNISGNTHNE